jgi:hypothetical protein
MSPANPFHAVLQREPPWVLLRRPGAAEHLLPFLLDRKATCELNGLGRLELVVDGLEQEGGAATIDEHLSICETFSLGGEAGHLLVERGFARHLVGKVTGGTATDLLLPPLSRIERGVLGGLLAASVAKLGLPLTVRLDARDLEKPTSMILVRLHVRLAGQTGRAWLHATTSAIERWSNALNVTVVVAMELSQTTLPKVQALGASAGDLVVFDETNALSPTSSWPLRLRCGERRLPFRLEPDGAVWAAPSRTDARAEVARSGSSIAGSAGQVVITAEIGRSSQSSEDSPPSPRGDGILLRMDEAAWAEGTMAAHEGRFAVRISQLIADR